MATDYRRVQALQAKLRNVRARAVRAKGDRAKAEREFALAQSQYNDVKAQMNQTESEAQTKLRTAMNTNRRMKAKLANAVRFADQHEMQLENQLFQAKAAQGKLSMQLEMAENVSKFHDERRHHTLEQMQEGADGLESSLVKIGIEVKELEAQYANLSSEYNPWKDEYNRQLEENDRLSQKSKMLVGNLTSHTSMTATMRKEVASASEKLATLALTPSQVDSEAWAAGAQEGATGQGGSEGPMQGWALEGQEGAQGPTKAADTPDEQAADDTPRLKEELRVAMAKATRLHTENARMAEEVKRLDEAAAVPPLGIVVQQAVPRLKQFVRDVEDAVTAELSDLEQLSFSGL